MRCAWLLAASTAVVACGKSSSGAADAAVFDAPPPIDAAVVACTADYAESGEASNDLALGGDSHAELSAITVSAGGTAVSLCGQIDPAEANDVTADADFFQFEIDQDLRLRAELRSADAAMLSGFEIALWFTNTDGDAVALLTRGGFRGTHGVVELGPLAAGLYAVSVTAALPAPAAPVLYSIDLLEDPDECASAPDGTYNEANDGSGSRGNDAVAVAFTPTAQFSSADSVPEATAILLSPAAVAELVGTSADVSPDGDAYRDRDAFEISTDAVTDELEIELTWDQPADLDLFVFEPGPGAELSAGAASLVGNTRQERVTIAVSPDSSYWVWIGAIDGSGGLPADYAATVCGRQFVP